MREITTTCRAKINLTLDILGRRPDGYHNLESVMQTIDLADALVLRPSENGEIELTMDNLGIAVGSSNTVFHACELFRKSACVDRGLSITIRKRVPTEAGLGGGSSDGAGTLIALNRLFGSPLSSEELSALAARIGSDVPYFLTGGTAVATGRGESVEALTDAPVLDLVIVKPNAGVSTALAYRKLSEINGRASARATPTMIEAVRRGDRAGVIEALSSDFEAVVMDMCPPIAEIKHEMAELGAEATLLCGSGSAVFGIFPGRDVAAQACKALGSLHPFAATARTTSEAIIIGENSNAS